MRIVNLNFVRKLTSGLERRFKVYTALSPLAMFGEVLMETTIPLVMAKIVDVGIKNRDVAIVLKLGGIMVAMSFFSLFCGAACGRLSSLAAFGFSRNLRRKLFNHVQSFSFSNMDTFGTGSLVTRLTTDVTNVQNLYQQLIRAAIRSPLMLIIGTIMAFRINSSLACVFFVAIPILALVLSLIATKAYPRFSEMFTKYDRLNTAVQECLIAIRVVKAFVREKSESERFNFIADDLRKTQVSAEKIVILNQPIMHLVVYSCILSVLWFGGNMILTEKMQLGELISFLTYINQILMSLMMLSMIFVQFILSRASVSRISEVLDVESDIKNPEKSENENSVQNLEVNSDFGIEFDHVFFSYDKNISNCVLSDVCLKIKSGATVGIIGGTGSSKSTLIQLIPRLYDVTSGSVKIGGKDVREWNLDDLRKNVAIVLQKNVLFSGTIAENLRWGNENASLAEIEEACRASDAHSFVTSFPNGYETELGQGGVNLSGGQKQRLCIARALLKKPRILILDDSTSAVDTATDLRIRSALKKEIPECTKLIIAQRIASVQDSDFIVVLNDGKIDGIGTHEELLETNRIYKEVYESQMSEN